MRSHPSKEERSPSDSTSPKQDPIERRRLQNRLSQRNHRRKIRDRIAKLQERVIASELRAAASLNGWNQSSPPGPAIDHSIPRYEVEGGLQPLAPETPMPMNSSYLPSPGACTTCGPGIGPIPVLSSQSSSSSLFELNGTDFEATSPSSSNFGNSIYQPFSTINTDMSLNMPASYSTSDLNTHIYSEPWFPQAQQYNLSNSNYYIATETTLPQIMQALGPSANRTKAIILIPQNTQAPGLPPTPARTQPQSPTGTITGTGANGMEPVPALTPLSLPHLACQCASMPGSPGPGGHMDWMGSGPGSTSVCPLHSGMEGHGLAIL